MIDTLRSEPFRLSWNQIGRLAKISKIAGLRDGTGAIGAVVQDAYHRKPWTEVYVAVRGVYDDMMRKLAISPSNGKVVDEELSKRKEAVEESRRKADMAAAAAQSQYERELGEVQMDEIKQRIRGDVVEFVALNPGTTRGDVVKEVRGQSQLVAQMIQSLVDEGLIEDRNPHPKRSELHLTEKARELLDTEVFHVPATEPTQTYPAEGGFEEITDLYEAGVMPDYKEPELPTPTTIRGKLVAEQSVEPLTWDSIRSRLLAVADDIRKMYNQLPLDGTPDTVRAQIADIYSERHDRLVRFVEEELE